MPALTGVAFGQAGLRINHTTVHQLDGQFCLSHGSASALLLIRIIRSNARDPRATKRYTRFARACRLRPDSANDTTVLNALIHHIGLFKK